MYRSRRSPSPRHRSSTSRRRSPSPRRRSPGPSRRRDHSREREVRSERKDTDLPVEFCRDRDDDSRKKVDDNRDVLERMEKSYCGGPLQLLHRAVKEQLKLKIWTRNFKEVRGICTGFLLAFDKHWNLALQDVDEICLKPKKGKTPYLRELKPGDIDGIPEAQPKVPRDKKKDKENQDVEKEKTETEISVSEATDDEGKETAGAGEKKRSRKKKKTRIEKRHVRQLFIRGDNVVMIAIIAPSDV